MATQEKIGLPDSEYLRTVEVVVKVAERCNINCTYCYVFNKGDDSYLRHDPYMRPETILSLAEFLGQGAAELNYRRISIDFHGGEPLMMKKPRFISMCEEIIRCAPVGCEVSFAIQTNAMLVDDDWLDIFERFNMAVGVSLDGPKEVNDANRIDHRGRGTYERTRRGLEQIVGAYREGRIRGVGILNVLNPSDDVVNSLSHFVDELNVDNVDFLLPIESHDSWHGKDSEDFGRALADLYDAWLARDDGAVTIRTINNALASFHGGARSVEWQRRARDGDHVILTVSSSGDLGPDDSLRTIDSQAFAQMNVRDASLAQFLASESQMKFLAAENTLPDACIECSWSNICRGGASNGRLVNRYSEATQFNNPSIMCDGLQYFYAHVAVDLLKRGLSFDRLKEVAMHNQAGLGSYTNDYNSGASA